jgi:hypothetical protein
VSERSALGFARDSLGSIWTLEVLLIMQQAPQRGWDEQELEQEIRGSPQIIREAVGVLSRAGLAVLDDRRWRYVPATPELANVVVELAKLHASKPMLLARTIFSSKSDRIRTFADAFRIRE